MKYLAIDPGGNTGYAFFGGDGILTEAGSIKGEDKFLDWLEEQDFDEMILEIYRNRPGMTHNNWSKGATQQHIGAIKRIAHKKKVPVHEQDPSPCLAMGLRFLGVYTQYTDSKGKLLHVPDVISATAHGTYYLRKAGIQK